MKHVGLLGWFSMGLVFGVALASHGQVFLVGQDAQDLYGTLDPATEVTRNTDEGVELLAQAQSAHVQAKPWSREVSMTMRQSKAWRCAQVLMVVSHQDEELKGQEVVVSDLFEEGPSGQHSALTKRFVCTRMAR